MVGLNYKQSGLELVSKAQFPSLEAAYSAIRRVPAVREVVVLQTCNRVEIYAITTNKKATEESIKSILEARVGEPIPDEKFVVKYGIDAARHLFRVASGLESMVLGEQDILRQVREAIDKAVKEGYAGKNLKHLFEAAVKVGKRVRTETALGKGSIGIPSASVKLLEELLGSLKGKKILVIGAGMAGRIVATNAAKKGAKVIIANRTLDKAKELAERVNGEYVSLEKVKDLLKEVDAVVSAIGGNVKIITYDDIKDVKKKLVIVDIAEPPSVDKKVIMNPNVVYKDIVSVANVANRFMANRVGEVEKAEKILEEELEKFVRHAQRVLADKVLRELMDKVNEIRLMELSKALSKVPKDYSDVLDKMSNALVKKVLKDVIFTIRNAAERGDLTTLRIIAEAFKLENSVEEMEIIYDYNGSSLRVVNQK